ncbi:MAG: CAP domain-containing protein [Cypionkella sp.]|nr:CAP domain-containing protein [Cypionkella sp.]
MNRRNALAFGLAALSLAACGGIGAPALGASTSRRTGIYKITDNQAQAIPFRALDAINAIRRATNLTQVQFSAELNAASLTHSRDMSVQNRPWHFGSDGSSPLLRAQRVGYRGRFLGELISETFETELQTISAWMKDPNTRSVLLDREVMQIGFAWYQESNGKIWWTLMTGA